jgi:tetratricopeptide (TPR) repeat protein
MPKHFIDRRFIYMSSAYTSSTSQSSIQASKVMRNNSLARMWVFCLSALLGGCAGLAKNNEVLPMADVGVQQEWVQLNRAEWEATKPVNSRASRKFFQATTAIGIEDYINAETLLLELISSFPEYASPRTNLALIYVNTGRVDEALPLLHDAIAMVPRDCIPQIQLALVERSRNEFAAAETAYLVCLKAEPGNAIAHLNLGILYELYMGRFEDALAAYDEYQQLVGTPDQRVAGWIANLSRRIKTTSQLAIGEHFK